MDCISFKTFYIIITQRNKEDKMKSRETQIGKKKDTEYFDKWDRSDFLPSRVLKEIRSADYYTDIHDYECFDNNDPRSCEVRLKAWERK